MKAGFRILYWIVAILFLLVTLGEAGFFAEAEGVVAGKKTYRIWGLPTGRRLLIKYQEPVGTDTGSFRNDESVSFSWDTRWTVSIIVLAFLFFAAFQYGRSQPVRYYRY